MKWRYTLVCLVFGSSRPAGTLDRLFPINCFATTQWGAFFAFPAYTGLCDPFLLQYFCIYSVLLHITDLIQSICLRLGHPFFCQVEVEIVKWVLIMLGVFRHKVLFTSGLVESGCGCYRAGALRSLWRSSWRGYRLWCGRRWRLISRL